MIENSLWVEKYRPKTIDHYVGNPDFIEKMKYWIENQDVPNIILYSEKSGTGKTTAAKLLASNIDADVKHINASAENGIDTVRDTISKFAETMGFSKWKIVVLEEFSRFSPSAQSALLEIIESRSKTTRFILTGNYIDKFLPAIVSRCIPFLIETPPIKAVYANLERILTTENVKFEPTDLAQIIKQYYPDQRAMLMYCQTNSQSGTLKYVKENIILNDYCTKIVEELGGRSDAKTAFQNIRQIIADAKVRQFDDLFRYLYDHLEDFCGVGKKASAIAHIADCQYKSGLVLDKEIQVAALIINLIRDCK